MEPFCYPRMPKFRINSIQMREKDPIPLGKASYLKSAGNIPSFPLLPHEERDDISTREWNYSKGVPL